MTRPNMIVYAEAATGAAVLLALALLGAHAHGRRRERRAWLMERGSA